MGQPSWRMTYFRFFHWRLDDIDYISLCWYMNGHAFINLRHVRCVIEYTDRSQSPIEDRGCILFEAQVIKRSNERILFQCVCYPRPCHFLISNTVGWTKSGRGLVKGISTVFLFHEISNIKDAISQSLAEE